MDPFCKLGRVQSRESRGRLVAELLAGAWRSHVPSPLNARKVVMHGAKQNRVDGCPNADELAEIAPLMLKSGAAALAWRKIRDSDLRRASAANQLQAAYRVHSLDAAFHERHLERITSVLRSQGAEPVLVKGWAT